MPMLKAGFLLAQIVKEIRPIKNTSKIMYPHLYTFSFINESLSSLIMFFRQMLSMIMYDTV
jgi:hypothetical protein